MSLANCFPVLYQANGNALVCELGNLLACPTIPPLHFIAGRDLSMILGILFNVNMYVNPTNFVFEVDTVLFCNDTAFIGMQ